MTTKPSTKKHPPKDDAFEAVAKRLGANPDMKEFDAKMRKIAKAKPKSGATK
jgi:hypothetical protein